jgi:ribosome-associated toxin RatA of RatAB toxin-antitoxin module
MTTKVHKRILVNVPTATAYNQWTQFEDFPQFMGGVQSVTQLSDDRLQWVAEIAGVKRQWEARILEQVPDRKIAWAATEGATNAGTVLFEDVGGGQTSITLELEYEPEGLVEKAGDMLNIVEKQAEGDLERFKAFIESEEYATGAWRGSINKGAPMGSPGVEAAAASRGDSGKAGISGKAAVAGAAAVAAGAAAVAAAKKSGDKTETTDATVVPPTTPVKEPVATTTPAPAVPVETRVESGTARLVDVDDPATGGRADEDVDPLTGEPLRGTTRDDRI